jgi:hypothetical protein
VCRRLAILASQAVLVHTSHQQRHGGGNQLCGRILDAVFLSKEMLGTILERPEMSYASNAVCGSAFQEAGHAVVARYFGLAVKEIEIRDDASGKTNTVGSTDDLPLIDRIAIQCAGQASRTIFRCRSQTSSDSSEISKLLEGLTEDHCLEVRNAGYRRAIEIVLSNAPEVERLASLLIEQRRVTEGKIAQTTILVS